MRHWEMSDYSRDLLVEPQELALHLRSSNKSTSISDFCFLKLVSLSARERIAVLSKSLGRPLWRNDRDRGRRGLSDNSRVDGSCHPESRANDRIPPGESKAMHTRAFALPLTQ